MKNKNIIAITAYNKPDLLYIHLEQIYKDINISNYKIRIHTEIGYDKEEDVVINYYKNKYPNIDLKLIIKEKHPKCSLVGFHNILSSYTISAEEASEYVIIGEEDILPTEDYIRFNDYIYRNYLEKYDRIFCVAHKRRPETDLIGDPEVLIGDYQCTSPSCVSVKTIQKYLKPFFEKSLFFEDIVHFNNIFFANSRIKPWEHTHHDGAIERIMEFFNLFALKPDQTRSMHVGLSGIFCGGTPPQGNLEERVLQWKELIKDGDKIRKLSTHPQDIVVTDPKGPKWDFLKLDINRNQAKASSWWYDTKNEFKKYIESTP